MCFSENSINSKAQLLFCKIREFAKAKKKRKYYLVFELCCLKCTKDERNNFLLMQSLLFLKRSNHREILHISQAIQTPLQIPFLLNNNPDYKGKHTYFCLFCTPYRESFTPLHLIFIKLVVHQDRRAHRLPVTKILHNKLSPEATCIIESLACPSQTQSQHTTNPNTDVEYMALFFSPGGC